MIKQFSIEDMTSALFGAGAGKGSYGFEAEDLSPEETAVIDGSADETPESVDVDDVDTNGDDQAEAVADLDGDAEKLEETETTAEAFACIGEAGAMGVALQSAETYLWSQEGVDVKATLKKFWEWIKGILEKIKTGIINIYRRVAIWLAGDMKKYSKFVTSLKAEEITAIENSDVEMKVALPKGKIENLADGFDTKALTSDLEAVASMINAGSYKNAAEIDACEKLIKENKNDINEAFEPVKTVTAKEFFAKYPLAELKNAEVIKKMYTKGQEAIKLGAKAVAAAQKAATKDLTDKEEIKLARRAGSVLQAGFHQTSSTLIAATHKMIGLSSTAVRFALKAKKVKKPEAKK